MGYQTAYVHDVDGNLTEVLEKTEGLNERSTTYAYGAPGLLTKVFTPVFPVTPIVENTYDAFDRVIEQKNPFGDTYRYYFAGNRSEEVNPHDDNRDGDLNPDNDTGRVWYYNKRGKEVRTLDRRTTDLALSPHAYGAETFYNYDGHDRVTSVESYNRVLTDLGGGQISEQLQLLNTVTYAYDLAHNTTQVARSATLGAGLADLVEDFTYDPILNVLKTATDARGNTTDFTYDANGNLTMTQAPLVPILGGASERPTTTMTYDARGLVTQVTDPEGRVTTYAYDAAKPLLTLVTVDPAPGLDLRTSYLHDGAGNVIQETSPKGNAAPTTYFTTFQYDLKRRLAQVTSPEGYVTNHVYDDNDRLISTEHRDSAAGPIQQTMISAYDIADNRFEFTDPRGHMSTFQYDTLNRLVSQTTPAGQDGPPATATLRTTKFEYDRADRQTKRIDVVDDGAGGTMDRTVEALAFNDYGLLTGRTNANGQTVTYAYDGFHRLVTTAYPPAVGQAATEERVLEYDENGNVLRRLTRRFTGSGNPADEFVTTYDALNRVTSRTEPATAIVPARAYGYGYDRSGRFALAIDGAGSQVVHGYDTAGRMSARAVDGKTVILSKDGNGNLEVIAWPQNGVEPLKVAAYIRDQSDRPTAMYDQAGTIHKLWGYDSVDRMNYNLVIAAPDVASATGIAEINVHDANKNLTAIVRLDAALVNIIDGVNYGYNFADEEISFDPAHPDHRWLPVSPETRAYGVNELDQLTDVTVDSQPMVDFTYDADGNLTDSGTHTYTYDAAGRLASAAITGTNFTIAYEYNAVGELSKRSLSDTVNTIVEGYIYANGALIAVTDGAGVIVRRFVPGPNGLTMSVDDAAAVTTYKHHDARGSLVSESDASGTVTARYAYGPWGEPHASWLLTAAPDRYTGAYWDAVADVYLFRARAYNPALGRWLQPDPAGPIDGPNLYAYVGNSPFKFIDPLGLARGTTDDTGNWQLVKDVAGDIGILLIGVGIDILTLPDPGVETGVAIGVVTARVAARKALRQAAKRTNAFLKAGRQLDRNGLTKAGRALQKHGDRSGSIFPKSNGSAAARNQQGQDVLKGILRSKNKATKTNRFGGKDVFDKNTGRGVRFDADGNMKGFLEP